MDDVVQNPEQCSPLEQQLLSGQALTVEERYSMEEWSQMDKEGQSMMYKEEWSKTHMEE